MKEIALGLITFSKDKEVSQFSVFEIFLLYVRPMVIVPHVPVKGLLGLERVSSFLSD